ncbi:MAG: porin family protein [Sulfurovum sp.]|jgi:opacity protein-like surface antigen|nr:porin family protein [Sulfurovum sp.]
MKKITASIVAAVAMNAFVFAGGDIAPVEPEVTVPEVVEPAPFPGAFYVGLGYAYMNMNIDEIQREEADISAHSALLLAGYNYNQYFGLEARYAMNIGDPEFDGYGEDDDPDGDFTNAAIYLKAMYPFEKINVYALLGYGQVTLDTTESGDHSESGFQWGLGANYAITENIGVFADYTRLYDDEGFDGAFLGQDVVVDSINLGVTYTF